MTIYDYVRQKTKETKQSGRYGTAGLYSSAYNSFLRFLDDESLTFSGLTANLIKNYEADLLQNGYSHNTISAYMRMLRSLFNKAYEQGVPEAIPVDDFFQVVFTGYEPTRKRAVSPALIRRLARLDLQDKPHLCFSRDLFLLSFYLCGIPFVDLANLRKSDIRRNTIYYYRQKTHQQLSVFIEPYAAEIISRYSDPDPGTPFLLPILKSSGEAGYRQYKSALRLYNQHLHQLSGMLGLKTPLTSYVARHTWATTAKKEGVSLSLISEGLGHSSEKVTHVYLDSFSDNEMSKANKKVISTIYPELNEKSRKKKMMKKDKPKEPEEQNKPEKTKNTKVRAVKREKTKKTKKKMKQTKQEKQEKKKSPQTNCNTFIQMGT